jgi:hypothetical protein
MRGWWHRHTRSRKSAPRGRNRPDATLGARSGTNAEVARTGASLGCSHNAHKLIHQQVRHCGQASVQVSRTPPCVSPKALPLARSTISSSTLMSIAHFRAPIPQTTRSQSASCYSVRVFSYRTTRGFPHMPSCFVSHPLITCSADDDTKQCGTTKLDFVCVCDRTLYRGRYADSMFNGDLITGKNTL